MNFFNASKNKTWLSKNYFFAGTAAVIAVNVLLFVIGGGEIYGLFLRMCEFAYVTRIETALESDAFFPNLDALTTWSHERIIRSNDFSGIRYSYHIYRNNDPAAPPLAAAGVKPLTADRGP